MQWSVAKAAAAAAAVETGHQWAAALTLAVWTHPAGAGAPVPGGGQGRSVAGQDPEDARGEDAPVRVPHRARLRGGRGSGCRDVGFVKTCKMLMGDNAVNLPRRQQHTVFTCSSTFRGAAECRHDVRLEESVAGGCCAEGGSAAVHSAAQPDAGRLRSSQLQRVVWQRPCTQLGRCGLTCNIKL
jgi:hypothetical protein